MKKRRTHIRHKASRVVLSELLPYELPVTFSNSGFYDFLNRTNVVFTKKDVIFRSGDAAAKTLLKVLFGKRVQITETVNADGKSYVIPRKLCDAPTVPFHFQIRHGERQSRRLSLPHPMSQISMIPFYEEYKSSILYNTSRSPFSVRHPERLTRYTIFRDSLFEERLDSGPGTIETTSNEYDQIRSYFVYKRYDNIHKFYESDEYRASEKRFGNILRLDISKCFDSIYTHSISWALFDKESVKVDRDGHATTFAESFDSAIRRMNDNETHGILIGPEISRIFAEMVLQRVDREVERALRRKKLVHGQDYEVLRYVDDYFIFMRDPGLRDDIVSELEVQLRPFRFHLNAAKEVVHSTPFISDMSIAKDRLRSGLNKNFELTVDEDEVSSNVKHLEFKSSSRKMIAFYKTVLRETNLEPVHIVNFTLAHIESQLEIVLAKYGKLATAPPVEVPNQSVREQRMRFQQVVVHVLTSALELAFFVYGGSPRVSPAIKLARLIALCRKFVEQARFSVSARDALDDLIYQDVLVQLNRNPLSEHATVENLYLLTVLNELGDHYLLDDTELCRFLQVEVVDSTYRIPDWFNPLIVAEVFRYISDKDAFGFLRSALEVWLVEEVTMLDSSPRSMAEQPIYVLNAISSPYVSESTKKQLLVLYGVTGKSAQEKAVEFQETWFTNWTSLDLHSALLQKRVQEVY